MRGSGREFGDSTRQLGKIPLCWVSKKVDRVVQVSCLDQVGVEETFAARKSPSWEVGSASDSNPLHSLVMVLSPWTACEKQIVYQIRRNWYRATTTAAGNVLQGVKGGSIGRQDGQPDRLDIQRWSYEHSTSANLGLSGFVWGSEAFELVCLGHEIGACRRRPGSESNRAQSSVCGRVDY